MNIEFIEDVNYPEVWKPIEGYEGLYSVSNYGRVKKRDFSYTRRVNGEAHTYIRKGLIIKFMLTGGKPNRRYLSAPLRAEDGKQKFFLVHRLVAKAFVDGYEEGLEVDHIDNNQFNNRADNLRWVTHAYNNAHRRPSSEWQFSGYRKPREYTQDYFEKKLSTLIAEYKDILENGADTDKAHSIQMQEKMKNIRLKRIDEKAARIFRKSDEYLKKYQKAVKMLEI